MNHSYNHSLHNGESVNGMQQSFHPQNDYYYAQTNEQLNHASGWYEVSCVEAGSSHGRGDAIHAIAYDPIKELIWAGTASGMLHAHYATDMSRIVSSYISEPTSGVSFSDDVRDVIVSKNSVLAAVGYGLAVVSRGGVLQASFHADTVRDAKAIALSPVNEMHVCIGGESRMLAVLDLEHQRILRQATLRGATGVTDALWVAPEGSSTLAIFSTATGRISFCDPASMREVNALAAFMGPTTSIASSGYYLAATGLGTRGGVPYLEPHVKMFDIRAVGTPLPPVMFPSPPMFVQFDAASGALYNTDCALWVLSPDGLLQLLDIAAIASGALPFPLSEEIRLDAGSDVLTSMAVSSSGMLALGDSGGFIHQWSCSEAVKVNEESDPIWTAQITTEPPTPSIRLGELLTTEVGTTIPKCAIPEFNNEFLTDEVFAAQDDHQSGHGGGRLSAMRRTKGVDPTINYYSRKAFARFPLTISDDILRNAKRQSFVGYAQAPPSYIRNSQSGHKKPPVIRGMRNTSTGWPRRASDHALDPLQKANSAQESSLDFSKPYAKSKYVEMDLVAWESIEGFDFIKYNQSKLFCGLENALPNVYVNAAVQVLYFSPPIRKAIGTHSCDRDWCISCELGFLFHMFDLGGAGMACEAGNFTRAFMTMANAGALGLLEGPHALPLAQRIENFTRYLLEQLRKDEDLRNESDVDSVFGAETGSYGVFTPSKTAWERISRPFQHTLMYDAKHTKDTTFCDLVEHSLSHSLEPTRAFCEAKGQFEIMSHRRELRELPNVLLLGCNTKSAQYKQWWFGTEAASSYAINGDGSLDDDVVTAEPAALDKIAAEAMRDSKKLVETMRIDLGDNVSVTKLDNHEGETPSCFGYDNIDTACPTADMGTKTAEYDLSFVVAHVPPSSADVYAAGGSRANGRNAGGHLVAYIRVPQEYRKREQEGMNLEAKDADLDSAWWCFNDFVISPCEGFDEVAAFDRRWKKPCVLGYVRRDIRRRVKPANIVAPLNVRDVIGSENQNAAVGLQHDEPEPGKGTLLALDCEFVMVGRDEADIFGDGTRRVVIPARMALARVSVIRGYGPLKGTALIDDYVAVREPVVDYLTRFSGLGEGDLDATRSKHKVSSLKTVYKRLRCLVDAGCVFVGHGLKSDFRIINFVVPPEQVIDTVTLFRVKNKRLLGLRFLSNALLGCDIQSETHDSIEDSDAALRLYEVYLRLKEGKDGENRFQRTLKDLYTYGYAHSWKADPEDPFKIDWESGG